MRGRLVGVSLLKFWVCHPTWPADSCGSARLAIPPEDEAALLSATSTMDRHECETVIAAARSHPQSINDRLDKIDGAARTFAERVRRSVAQQVNGADALLPSKPCPKHLTCIKVERAQSVSYQKALPVYSRKTPVEF